MSSMSFFELLTKSNAFDIVDVIFGGGSGLVAGPGFKSGREAVKVVSGVFDSHTSPPLS